MNIDIFIYNLCFTFYIYFIYFYEVSYIFIYFISRYTEDF